MRFCPSCGVERVARFCSGCGFDFDQNPEPELASDQETPGSITENVLGDDFQADFVVEDFNSDDATKETTSGSMTDLITEEEASEVREQLPSADNEAPSGLDLVGDHVAGEVSEGLEQLDTLEAQVRQEQLVESLEPEPTDTVQNSGQQEDKELPVAEEEVIDAALAEHEPEVATVTPPKPEGWYSDPINKTRFRYWDGINWTDRTASKASEVEVEQEVVQVHYELAAPVVLEGLTYGNKYRAGSSCFNCGFMPGDRTNFCECCGATLRAPE